MDESFTRYVPKPRRTPNSYNLGESFSRPRSPYDIRGVVPERNSHFSGHDPCSYTQKIETESKKHRDHRAINNDISNSSRYHFDTILDYKIEHGYSDIMISVSKATIDKVIELTNTSVSEPKIAWCIGSISSAVRSNNIVYIDRVLPLDAANGPQQQSPAGLLPGDVCIPVYNEAFDTNKFIDTVKKSCNHCVILSIRLASNRNTFSLEFWSTKLIKKISVKSVSPFSITNLPKNLKRLQANSSETKYKFGILKKRDSELELIALPTVILDDNGVAGIWIYSKVVTKDILEQALQHHPPKKSIRLIHISDGENTASMVLKYYQINSEVQIYDEDCVSFGSKTIQLPKNLHKRQNLLPGDEAFDETNSSDIIVKLKPISGEPKPPSSTDYSDPKELQLKTLGVEKGNQDVMSPGTIIRNRSLSMDNVAIGCNNREILDKLDLYQKSVSKLLEEQRDLLRVHVAQNNELLQLEREKAKNALSSSSSQPFITRRYGRVTETSNVFPNIKDNVSQNNNNTRRAISGSFDEIPPSLNHYQRIIEGYEETLHHNPYNTSIPKKPLPPPLPDYTLRLGNINREPPKIESYKPNNNNNLINNRPAIPHQKPRSEVIRRRPSSTTSIGDLVNQMQGKFISDKQQYSRPLSRPTSSHSNYSSTSSSNGVGAKPQHSQRYSRVSSTSLTSNSHPIARIPSTNLQHHHHSTNLKSRFARRPTQSSSPSQLSNPNEYDSMSTDLSPMTRKYLAQMSTPQGES
ncbi:hypothetical protein H4219_003383 [Mycoemilia scoparia]|uniref:Uncharacterized protein n=1 Tax=Mycoemilia scoparia TaxID=417184 RepID=A0A9W8DPB7_9FUNG|nr:hypothetical protein H4219_003383 [Mycoemilia scoparia]